MVGPYADSFELSYNIWEADSLRGKKSGVTTCQGWHNVRGGIMSWWHNVRGGKMYAWHNVRGGKIYVWHLKNVAKCPFFLGWYNAWVTKCWGHQMSGGKMSKWLNVGVAKCWVDPMSDGKMLGGTLLSS